jgi:hypothetical protein
LKNGISTTIHNGQGVIVTIIIGAQIEVSYYSILAIGTGIIWNGYQRIVIVSKWIVTTDVYARDLKICPQVII